MSMALLSAYTSFGIGGEADIAVIHDLEDAAAVLKDDCIILGRGTNVLASDKGSGKKVVVNRLGTLTFDGEHVYAGSGVTLVTLCAACAERGLGNMEWACGIPGSVGGAVLMNAGAYGGCIADSLVYADVLRNGKIVRLSREDCRFAYRQSAVGGGDFVLGAMFRLSFSSQAEILSRMRALQYKRNQNQPKGRSAGSVYLKGEKPAGWYIEQSGLKGAREGGAVVSEKHANFILNTGGATAKDVLTLMERIETEVYKNFGVRLKREIRLIGDF